MPTAKYVPEQVVQQAALLAWAVAMGVVTPEALAEREDVSIAVARERLDAAVSLEYLTRKSVLVGYPALYMVTRAGRSLARKHQDAGGYVYQTWLRKCRVNIKGARHTIACAGVRAALERRYPDHRVIGELELSRDESDQKRRLATVEVRAVGGGRVHRPDMVIWPPPTPVTPAPPDLPSTPATPAAPDQPSTPADPAAPDLPSTPPDPAAPDPSTPATPATPQGSPLPVPVEVELTIKGREELLENCRAWAGCRYVEAVIYFAETRSIEEKLLDAIEELGAGEMIVVNPLSEILKQQPGFPLTDD
jgi:hypothetical protein